MRQPLIVLFVIMLLTPFAFAEYTTQQTQHLLLMPFYVMNGAANTNTTSTLGFNPPDGVNGVQSAIITYEVWMSPTVTFTAWVNGKSCNNPSYTISTIFSGSGNANIHFDCTNTITTAGSYNVTLRSTSNYGSSTGWADIVYTNNPTRNIFVSGTDYAPGDNAKVFTTLVDTGGNAVNSASCFVEMFYPNSSDFVTYTPMSFLEDGIYYYDFTAPSVTGVYPVEVRCTYLMSIAAQNASTGTRNLGAGSGALNNVYAIDNAYWTATENAGDVRLIDDVFNYTGYNETNMTLKNIVVSFTGKRPSLASDPASDPVRFWLYNYNTSKYDLVGNDFSYIASDETHNYVVSSNLSNYFSNLTSGTVSVRINDTVNTSSGDGANTILSIDQVYVYVISGFSNSSVTTIAGGGELNVRNHVTNVTCSINATDVSLSVWNSTSRNLTYYPPANVSINNTDIANSVWSSNATISGGLLSQITSGVWNYVARYVHGVLV
jgi:hypothetical protein